jgi:thiol-disulfide isomerase/thioredoxin
MPMRIGTQMPTFEGATEWHNGSSESVLEAAKGRPTLVHFWSLSCGICKDNLPRVAELRDTHGKDRLYVVAVHMPRYESDTDIAAVREAITANAISEPCAIDNAHTLRDAFVNENGYVPAYYLFDAGGKLRSFAAGERGLNMIAPALQRTLETSS